MLLQNRDRLPPVLPLLRHHSWCRFCGERSEVVGWPIVFDGKRIVLGVACGEDFRKVFQRLYVQRPWTHNTTS